MRGREGREGGTEGGREENEEYRGREGGREEEIRSCNRGFPDDRRWNACANQRGTKLSLGDRNMNSGNFILLPVGAGFIWMRTLLFSFFAVGGISAKVRGSSRTWPMQKSTSHLSPPFPPVRKRLMVLALVADSTMIRLVPDESPGSSPVPSAERDLPPFTFFLLAPAEVLTLLPALDDADVVDFRRALVVEVVDWAVASLTTEAGGRRRCR